MAFRATLHRTRIMPRALTILRRLLLMMGAVSLLMIGLAFTPIPFHAHRWLGTHGGLVEGPVGRIILLSGSGMPSGPELMRCHQAALQAARSPSAQVVLALPRDTALARAMIAELALRGVASDRIILLMHGRNTREQALDAAHALKGTLERNTALITSPTHAYRALRTFRKVGFTRINGAPAFNTPLYTSLEYAHRRVGGKPYVPDVSGSTELRYDFWNRMELQIACLRELAALCYYRMNSWI